MKKPVHVVNEYVRLADTKAMKNFINAVLRRVAKDLENGSLFLPQVRSDGVALYHFKQVDLDLEGEERVQNLSGVYSHSEWMIRRWLLTFGFENTLHLLQHNNALNQNPV